MRAGIAPEFVLRSTPPRGSPWSDHKSLTKGASSGTLSVGGSCRPWRASQVLVGHPPGKRGCRSHESTNVLPVLGPHELIQMWLESLPKRKQAGGHPLACDLQLGIWGGQTDRFVPCQPDI